jgi:hypothetical protein
VDGNFSSADRGASKRQGGRQRGQLTFVVSSKTVWSFMQFGWLTCTPDRTIGGERVGVGSGYKRMQTRFVGERSIPQHNLCCRIENLASCGRSERRATWSMWLSTRERRK